MLDICVHPGRDGWCANEGDIASAPHCRAPFIAATPAGIRVGRGCGLMNRPDVPDWVVTPRESAAVLDGSVHHVEEIWTQIPTPPTPRCMEPSPRDLPCKASNASEGQTPAVVAERELSLITVDLEASTPDVSKKLDMDDVFSRGPTTFPVIPSAHPQPLPQVFCAPLEPPLVEPPRTVVDTFCQFFVLFQNQACCRPAALPESCGSQCRQGRAKRQSIGEVQFPSQVSLDTMDDLKGIGYSRESEASSTPSHETVYSVHRKHSLETHWPLDEEFVSSLVRRSCCEGASRTDDLSVVHEASVELASHTAALASAVSSSTQALNTRTRAPPCGGA